MNLVIGVDFDNTLAEYGKLFRDEALRRGLLAADAPACKTAVRDLVRALPEGETRWRELQARVYGPRMPEAIPVDGAMALLAFCRDRAIPLSVVSHKSRFAAAAPEGPDLRAAALSWMRGQGFFDPALSPLREEDVFFEDTRTAKAGRIAALGCTHFIDDLPEVFAEPDYPVATAPLLLCGDSPKPDNFSGLFFASLRTILNHLEVEHARS